MNFIPNSVAIATNHGFLSKGLSQFISTRAGFQIIHEAASETNLVAQILSTQNVPHICILDVWHSTERVWEYITADLKNLSAETRVLVLLSELNKFVILKMVDAGVNCILPKNCSDSELIYALERLRKDYLYYTDNILALLESEHVMRTSEFSNKERKFLSLCCSELTYKEIADRMVLSLRAIESIREGLFKKLDAVSRTGMVIKALKNGIISI